MRLKGAFTGCKWCGGNGCLQCDDQREKAEKQALRPLFSADIGNPDDMALLKEFAGAEAIEHAFGPDGGGMREVHAGALLATLKQLARKKRERE